VQKAIDSGIPHHHAATLSFGRRGFRTSSPSTTSAIPGKEVIYFNYAAVDRC